MAQLRRLFCEQDEDALCDFLGLMRVADAPQRDGINQIDVPCNQRRKGLVGGTWSRESKDQFPIRMGVEERDCIRRRGTGNDSTFKSRRRERPGEELT